MKTLGIKVSCRECGKTLRGVEGVTRGLHVRKHKQPNGTTCRGHFYTDHTPRAPVAS